MPKSETNSNIKKEKSGLVGCAIVCFFRISNLFRISILGFSNHVLDQIHATIGITPFVVVPANELEEAFVELDAGAGVENAGMGVVDEVGRHHLVARVSEDALEIGLTGFLESRADLFVTG